MTSGTTAIIAARMSLSYLSAAPRSRGHSTACALRLPRPPWPSQTSLVVSLVGLSSILAVSISVGPRASAVVDVAALKPVTTTLDTPTQETSD